VLWCVCVCGGGGGDLFVGLKATCLRACKGCYVSFTHTAPPTHHPTPNIPPCSIKQPQVPGMRKHMPTSKSSKQPSNPAHTTHLPPHSPG
jgi:hypothetical protein